MQSEMLIVRRVGFGYMHTSAWHSFFLVHIPRGTLRLFHHPFHRKLFVVSRVVRLDSYANSPNCALTPHRPANLGLVLLLRVLLPDIPFFLSFFPVTSG